MKLSVLLPPPSVSKLANDSVVLAFEIVPVLADEMFQVFAAVGPVNVSPAEPPMNDSKLVWLPRFVAVLVVKLIDTGVL